jgi:hypothetical protein
VVRKGSRLEGVVWSGRSKKERRSCMGREKGGGEKEWYGEGEERREEGVVWEGRWEEGRRTVMGGGGG